MSKMDKDESLYDYLSSVVGENTKFNNRAEFVQYCTGVPSALLLLLDAKVVMDVRAIGLQMLYGELPTTVSFTRGPDYRITSLSDGTNFLDGDDLERFLGVATYLHEGMEYFVFEDDRVKQPFAGVAIPPANIELHNYTVRIKGKDEPRNGRILHYRNRSVICALDDADVECMLSMKGLQVNALPKLLRLLNEWKKYDPTVKLQDKTLAQVGDSLEDSTLTTKARSFLDQLYGAMLSSADLPSKLNEIVARPSVRLILSIRFPRPMSGRLFQHGIEVKPVKLSKLSDGQSVLLQALPIDESFIKSLAADPEVYPAGAYTVKRGRNTFASIAGTTTISKNDMARLVGAVRSLHEPGEVQGVAKREAPEVSDAPTGEPSLKKLKF